LATGQHLLAPSTDEVRSVLIEHVNDLHNFYGDFMGVRFARKHVSWYMLTRDPDKKFRSIFNGLESVDEQLDSLNMYFDNLT
jgi:tRNA-dihydrouridine synthase B